MKFFALFLPLLLAANFSTAQKLTPERLDFSKISASTTKKVVLKNDTSKPIVIGDVVSDCNCTLVSYSKKPIMSGDSTILSVTYKPQKGERGVFYKVVTVVLASKRLEFTLRGVVE